MIQSLILFIIVKPKSKSKIWTQADAIIIGTPPPPPPPTTTRNFLKLINFGFIFSYIQIVFLIFKMQHIIVIMMRTSTCNAQKLGIQTYLSVTKASLEQQMSVLISKMFYLISQISQISDLYFQCLEVGNLDLFISHESNSRIANVCLDL